METLTLGKSELPIEVVIEYMESLAETYNEDVRVFPIYTMYILYF